MSLSALWSWKPASCSAGINQHSHVSVKHKTADEEKSLFFPNSSCNPSSLLDRERTLGRIIPGKPRFIDFQNVDNVDVTSSFSIRSSASREHVALQFIMPVGGCGCVSVWFQGLLPNPCFFFRSQLTTVNNGNRGGAAVFAVGTHRY